jgi:hypothetical protein
MSTSKIFLIVGLLTIIFIMLWFYIFYTIDNANEGFQVFSQTQVQDMNPCKSGTPNCFDLKYYDPNGILHSGSFSNLPYNFYLDVCNILQPVPSGNTVTSDRRGYMPKSNSETYSAAAKLPENVILDPSKCTQSKLVNFITDISRLSDALTSEYKDKSYKYPYYPITKTVCSEVDYLIYDVNKNVVATHGTIIIPDGYYINAGVVMKVPYGYTASADKKSIKINVDFQKEVSSTTYDTNNYNVNYHIEPSNNYYSDTSTAGIGKMWVLDHSGNLISIPYNEISGNTLYNEPGSFRFGPSNYVPNYEESVYLSKLTNISTVTPLETEKLRGFCNSMDKNTIEQKCNSLNKDTCASTSCCVLLGGQKCVYGNDTGPLFKTNYSNFLITNPEFYYYQGKCYGKCY